MSSPVAPSRPAGCVTREGGAPRQGRGAGAPPTDEVCLRGVPEMALMKPTKSGIDIEQAKVVVDELARADVGDVLVAKPLDDDAATVTGRVCEVEMDEERGTLSVAVAGEDGDTPAYTVTAVTDVQNLESKSNPSPQLYTGEASGESEDVCAVRVIPEGRRPRTNSPPGMAELTRGPGADERDFASTRAEHAANAL